MLLKRTGHLYIYGKYLVLAHPPCERYKESKLQSRKNQQEVVELPEVIPREGGSSSLLCSNRHLLLTHGDAVGLPLANWLIGGLLRARAALDVDFLVGDRHIHALLLGHHVFAQTCLA